MELSRLFRSFLSHFHIFADFCLCSWRIFCIANVLLFLIVCDVIFCVLAKCITSDFSRFFKGAWTFLTPKLPLAVLRTFWGSKRSWPPQKTPKLPIIWFTWIKNCSEGNSEHFYLPRNGSEQKYQVLSVFPLYEGFRSEFRAFFYLLRNVSERNSESFLFRKTDRISTEQTKISICSVFRGIISFLENGNPSYAPNQGHSWAIVTIGTGLLLIPECRCWTEEVDCQ